MNLVVEPAMHGTGHSAINAGIISSLRAAFPRQPLRFAAEAEHLAEVQRLLGAAPLMDGEFRHAPGAARLAAVAFVPALAR